MSGNGYRKNASIGAARGDGTPDASALAVINTMTLRDLAADDVYVREAIIAHNGIDRDRESISDALLDGFTRTLPGKGFFVSHPGGWTGTTGPGEGRWYSAHTVRMSLDQARVELGKPDLRWPDGVQTAVLLKGSFYLPRKTAAELIDRIDAGVARDISIQFTAKSTDEHRDEDGRLLWRLLDAPGEALEASLVWLGAQPGARVTKHATPTDSDDEDTVMSKELADKLKAAEAERDSAKAAAASHAALVKALGEDAALVDDPDSAAALIRAGKAFREELVNAIVTHERTLGLVGDDDAAVKAARDTYALLTTDKLDALAKRYGAHAGSDGDGAKAPAGGTHTSAIGGGDPNAGAPAAKNKASPGAGTFLDNPAITGMA